VNIIADGPPAMTLGLEPPGSDVMQRQPRPPDEPLVNRSRLTAMLLSGLTMMVGTLTVFHVARQNVDDTVAQTMAFTTFVVMQLFNVLNARSETRSVFGRDTFRNGKLWLAVAAVALLQVLVTTWSALQSVFDTTALTLDQWLVCVGVAAGVLVVEEVRKLVVRVLATAKR
jgi:Ca2+-transporting ATPase